MAATMKMVIDCDPGTDDCQAILMALSQPHVQVVAITTVFGNAKVSDTSYNALRVLKVANRLDIPVYVGCESSLIGIPSRHNGFHGWDGLGDFKEDDPPSRDLLQKEHAVTALLKLVNKHKGELTLVTLGPLTNIAVALKMDPEFGQKLKDCYVMGGAYLGKGNVATTIEYNFWSDPEAAYAILNHLGKVVTMVPIEPISDAYLPWEWYTNFLSMNTAKTKFIESAQKPVISKIKEKWGAYTGAVYPVIWDQCAMAVAIDNKVAVKTTPCYATIELHGEMTRGQVVVDWPQKLQKETNVNIVTALDQDMLQKMLIKAVSE